MASAATAPAQPAMKVFESLRFDLAQAQLPPGAERSLDMQLSAANHRTRSPGIGGRLLGSATFWLAPILILLCAWGARGQQRSLTRAWVGGLFSSILVYLAVLAAATVVYGAF
jgi:hypothetical protein